MSHSSTAELKQSRSRVTIDFSRISLITYMPGGCGGPSPFPPRQRSYPQALPSLLVLLHLSIDRRASERCHVSDTSRRRFRSSTLLVGSATFLPGFDLRVVSCPSCLL